MNTPSQIIQELVKVIEQFCDCVEQNNSFKVSKKEVDGLTDTWDYLEKTLRELYRRIPKK